MKQQDKSHPPEHNGRGDSAIRRILSAALRPRHTGRIEGELGGGAIGPFLQELQAAMRQGRPLKTDRAIDVQRVPWRGRELVVKWYKHVSWFHSLRHSLKGSRACRAWVNGHRLLALGIHTPLPLAFVDEYRGSLLWQSYLITEYVAGPTLHAVLRDHRVPDDRKQEWVEQTFKLINRLESCRINHGDMKHTNLLCDRDRIVLTDLDGMSRHGLAWLHRRRNRDAVRFRQAMETCRSETNKPDGGPTATVETPAPSEGL